MDKLTLCKRIAEIEGVPFHEAKSQNKNGIVTTLFSYNPLKYKALLWDLRLKYKVEIDDDCKTCRIWVIPGGDCFVVDYETDEDLPRAMLEVIVESKRNA